MIDAKHKPWSIASVIVAVIALAVYWLLARTAAEGLPGGSLPGMAYGLIGSGLMIYAGLLSALRKVPAWWWIGPRKRWMRGHIWLGALSGVFLLCHSGFHWGGPLEIALWIAFIGVVVTGIYGVVAQQLLPRMLTGRVPYEAPYEQIPHICQVMRRQADDLVDSICGAYDPSPHVAENTLAAVQYAGDAQAQLRDFYEQHVRLFLSPSVPGDSPLLNPLHAEARFAKLKKLPGLAESLDKVDTLVQYCDERRTLLEQERIHFWLHAWLLIHVPLSIMVLVLGITHAVTALRW